MKNIRRMLTLAAVSTLVACGGGESDESESHEESAPSAQPAPAAQPLAAPSGPMTTPEWFAIDAQARTVHLSVTAGATPDNNHWNFNGATKGQMAITVPEGYRVTIEFTNRDPSMGHSLGISAETSNFTLPLQPTPVFAGAISSNPTNMLDATMTGETETIEFVAERAGSYSMVCFIPGHAAVGMWLHFNVSSGGEAGVQTS